jgi:predicted nucleotidyltransferase
MQVQAITSVFQDTFSHGKVILFGSRVDDEKKGGDIDLFIEPAEPMSDLFTRKIKFLTALKKRIGEQKIDLVLAPFAADALKQEVKKKGVLLCQK